MPAKGETMDRLPYAALIALWVGVCLWMVRDGGQREAPAPRPAAEYRPAGLKPLPMEGISYPRRRIVWEVHGVTRRGVECVGRYADPGEADRVYWRLRRSRQYRDVWIAEAPR